MCEQGRFITPCVTKLKKNEENKTDQLASMLHIEKQKMETKEKQIAAKRQWNNERIHHRHRFIDTKTAAS